MDFLQNLAVNLAGAIGILYRKPPGQVQVIIFNKGYFFILIIEQVTIFAS